METQIILLIFVLVLSIFLGVELITKVPSTLHTPLMSGANAISGITLVGAILSSGSSEIVTIILGTAAVPVVRALSRRSSMHLGGASKRKRKKSKTFPS